MTTASSSEYPYRVPDELIRDYRRDGFVVTPNVLDAAALDRFGKAVDEEITRRTVNDERAVTEKSTYEQSFIQCMRLWETSPAVAPLTLAPALAGIATQLMGVDGVTLWQDQALYKEAGGRETTPHQDQTFWPLGTQPLISAWIPFDDVTLNDGAMAYVPGSHRHGRLKVVDITHTTDPYDILNDPAIAGVEPRFVEVEAGSVIWHGGLTVHMAAANRSDRTRRVFTVVYLDANARRTRSWPVYPLDRDGIKEGELIQGPGMPRLWPAPMEPPEPPEDPANETGPQHL